MWRSFWFAYASNVTFATYVVLYATAWEYCFFVHFAMVFADTSSWWTEPGLTLSFIVTLFYMPPAEIYRQELIHTWKWDSHRQTNQTTSDRKRTFRFWICQRHPQDTHKCLWYLQTKECGYRVAYGHLRNPSFRLHQLPARCQFHCKDTNPRMREVSCGKDCRRKRPGKRKTVLFSYKLDM